MKTTAYVMKSMMCVDPPIELSEDISRQICDKLFQLRTPCDIFPRTPSGYTVEWDGPPMVRVVVHGPVVCLYCFGHASYLEDTEGLEDLLKSVLGPI